MQISSGRAASAPRQARPDGHGLIVAFKPDEEGRAIRSGETLLIQPVVVSAKIGINERSDKIVFDGIALPIKQFVHRLLSLARGKSNQHGEWLSAAEGLASCPLRERSTEN